MCVPQAGPLLHVQRADRVPCREGREAQVGGELHARGEGVGSAPCLRTRRLSQCWAWARCAVSCFIKLLSDRQLLNPKWESYTTYSTLEIGLRKLVSFPSIRVNYESQIFDSLNLKTPTLFTTLRSFSCSLMETLIHPCTNPCMGSYCCSCSSLCQKRLLAP